MTLSVRAHQVDLDAFRKGLVTLASAEALVPVDVSHFLPRGSFFCSRDGAITLAMFPPLMTLPSSRKTVSLPDPFFLKGAAGPYVQVSNARAKCIFLDSPLEYVFYAPGGIRSYLLPGTVKGLDLFYLSPEDDRNVGVILEPLAAAAALEGAQFYALPYDQRKKEPSPTLTMT